MNQVTIPEGYRMDAQKRLVAEVLIKPVDLARDQLVMELVGKAKAVQEELSRFKASAFGDIEAFVDLSVEQYGVKRGGKKGNVSLLSFDGRYMIKKAIQETIQFDERIEAARVLIDECLRDWTQGARPEVVTLVSNAFRTDTNGEIRTARVLALRRLDIPDERWQRAMKAIGEACQAVGSKSYIRLYERVGDSDQYEQISLDMAGV
ncbi:DUF3164 family protein [Pseudomonas sp. ZM23]|uniref:DUF3164 family protein n=1 Tax=Pseudomonas triclosanedens TaxID=2961893 RepID=A0ABY6ZW68_9PSED|nr:DUF3164 family protein [Pseudomonas triclosanedens]MCP8465222.1 DUF3164 family protein [Pseudomonas triclosanedens]MCP8470838.1 DUF3164 family protein [Pseudomonas triclosanedens]MCP8476593.1 DUF3164 family protein [Pseudomonas triclosanedens]WAI49021.1 DUF3164 family protein [Pseudomonas triclosanedens]